MKEQIAELIKDKVEGLELSEIVNLIELPPKPELGDYAFPCFRLAKTMRKAPQIIAQEICDSIEKPDYLEKIVTEGAYINFFTDKTSFAKGVITNAIEDSYGSSKEGNGKTICIDYSSPNVAKNFHVGHLRTTVIGNSLYKIYSKLGYHVERINHLGDWGTQFGKLIVAYKNWGSEEAVKEKGIEELMRIYVLFHEEAEKNPELEDEARAWFHKMETGDEEALKIWEWFIDISLEEFKRIYKLMGMDFDHFTGESFYRNMTDDVVKTLKDHNLLTDSEGAKIVDLSEYDMAPCIVVKNDGSSIYATRDLAAVMYRKKTYNFDKCLYVTGQEQKLHFSQVFKVIELLGNDWAKDGLVHIPYGLVSLGGEKLSTRGGNVIYAEDILKEAISKIREIIDEKNPDLSDAEKEEASRIVGVGAVIFNDLYNQRIKDVSFKWEHITSFEGETGPYVQYTYARCSSILRNIENYEKALDVNTIDYSVLTDPASVDLLKEISKFGAIIADAAEKFEPSVVARYAVDLAQAFNRFYTDNRIAVDEENVRNARCAVTYITRRILKDSLDLLGIGCVERM